ncbi:MAG: Histone deacetylase domain protein [Gemmatimonadetes bacterium]|nr:Histone deacetylase domain protein [Gemmatimonadota bacterium]
MLTAWSSSKYTFPLPDGHRFPISKYAMLRQRVAALGITINDPPAATDEQLLLVHTDDYVTRFNAGTLTDAEVRRLGFPWSPALVERSRRAVGGTIAAAAHALSHGVSMNLAGGTHHAFADHGEGFCVYNDIAVAIRVLQHAILARRAAVVDLDVHQGNGTHSIFAGDANVFTFSMHGGKNYPFHKVAGDLDVELPDATGDDDYMAALQHALPEVLSRAAPDIVFYIAGADPHDGDTLGRLALSFDGLARRDAYVLQQCREVGIPVAITIGGGYGRRIEDTVAVHTQTARIASTFP